MKKGKKILVIVESPNKIKKLQSFLGKDFVIKASFGHIYDLIHNAKNKLGINIEKDYKLTYGILKDKKDKIDSIIDASKGTSLILIASDNDLEGAAIAYHIKDCLESAGIPIKRATFNEITKSAVLKAIQNPIDFGEETEKLYRAQQARRALDRIVGFMVSPFLIEYFGGEKLSAGRVQSVAVRIIVDREHEIEVFKPEEYWNIFANLAKKTSSEKFEAKYIKKITNKKDAMKVKADLEKDSYKVIKVEAKEKKRNPLPPLTTPKLQQAVAARYGFSVSKTMKAAQSLYETGLCTYIRTDSVKLSPEAITAARDWITKNNYKVPSKPNYYASKGSAQEAHEAIRPTDVFKTPDKVYLTDDQQKVYRVIWERFVASQMEPALYDTVSITVESSSGHELKANGRTLKYAGWLAVASDLIKSNDDEDDIQLPILKEGDKLVLVPPNVKAEQKFTQPPPRYSEAGLVKELEKRGIGRPSTYADIIDKIKARGYVELKGKTYHGTETGKKVVEILKKHFKFIEIDYTAKMEEQLDKIAEGKLKYVEMMDGFFKPFQKELKEAYLGKQEDFGFKCPKCKNRMILKHGRFGFYLSCIEGSKVCKTTLSCDMIDGKPVLKENFKQEVVDVDCPLCNSQMVKRDGKFGPFYACSKWRETGCKGTRKIPFGKKCSKCNGELFLTVFNGLEKLACMEFPNCRNVEDLPKGSKIDWIDPNKIKVKKPKRSIKKILDISK